MSQFRDSHLPTIPPDTCPTHPPTESSHTREAQEIPPTESHPQIVAQAQAPEPEASAQESTRYQEPLVGSRQDLPQDVRSDREQSAIHAHAQLSLEPDKKRTGMTTLISKIEDTPRDVNTTQRSHGSPQSVRVVRDEARMQRLEEQLDLLDARVRLLVKSADRTRVWLIASHLTALLALLFALLR